MDENGCSFFAGRPELRNLPAGTKAVLQQLEMTEQQMVEPFFIPHRVLGLDELPMVLIITPMQ